MPDYSFSTFAQLIGANCRTLSFQPEGAVFTTKRKQTYHYTWATFEPKLRHFRGSFFDTLVVSWENQRVRLNGIAKTDVTNLIDDLYFNALMGRESEILEHYQYLTKIIGKGYIPHSKWLALQSRLLPLADWFEILPQINNIPETLKLALSHLRFWQQSQVENLIKYNQAVMDKEKLSYKHLFDNLETHPLTEKQRDACLVANDANLVLAGAGCGKTSVMLGRCAYLLESQQTSADSILILAFAKDAAQEMKIRLKQRLPNKRIMVKTFHALALDIIKQVETNKPNISKLATSDNAKLQFFKSIITDLLLDADFKALFSDYCYAYVSWLGKLPANKHDQEVMRLLAGKGGYKKLLSQLAELTMAYKNNQSTAVQKSLNALNDSEFAAITHELVAILLGHYQAHLDENNAIDFDGMITKAIDYVREGKFNSPWLHILVDEFQDISQARAELVRQLQVQHDDSKLFCVGDDWQAIYQFAGSDIAVTTRFSDYFGIASRLPLDTTFRFNDQISAVATQFVMHNPEQISKQITSLNKVKKACVEINYYPQGDDAQALLLDKTLSNIQSKIKTKTPSKITTSITADANTDSKAHSQEQSQSVLLLARFNFQLPDNKQMLALSAQYPQLAIQAMTVHSAKGQEADSVIVLAMEAGEHGFPCHKQRHPLAVILQPDVSVCPDAEERRLFYVALTRARHQVYLLCNKDKPSSFVEELIAGDYAVKVIK